MAEVVIPARFNGPPETAHGGYACAVAAQFLGWSAEVSLWRPPPLERPLDVHRDDDGSVTLLDGDAADAVARLREQPGGDLVVLGSGELAQSLMRNGLVDEYTLLIYPLVLGSGRRLFREDGMMAKLRLVESRTTPKGVVIGTYQPED